MTNQKIIYNFINKISKLNPGNSNFYKHIITFDKDITYERFDNASLSEIEKHINYIYSDKERIRCSVICNISIFEYKDMYRTYKSKGIKSTFHTTVRRDLQIELINGKLLFNYSQRSEIMYPEVETDGIFYLVRNAYIENENKKWLASNKEEIKNAQNILDKEDLRQTKSKKVNIFLLKSSLYFLKIKNWIKL